MQRQRLHDIINNEITRDGNFKKKKMKELTNEQQISYQNAKICYICKEQIEDKHAKDKKYCKVRDHCHYTEEYEGAAHCICNLKYIVPKEISIVFTMDITMIIFLS